jgi:hypothetical protein
MAGPVFIGFGKSGRHKRIPRFAVCDLRDGTSLDGNGRYNLLGTTGSQPNLDQFGRV